MLEKTTEFLKKLPDLPARIRSSTALSAGFWYVIERAVAAICFLISVPLFSRLLSPADYGLCAVFAAWMVLFSLILPLNLHSSLSRAKLDFSGHEYERYVSSIITLAAISTTIAAICAHFFFSPEFILKVFGLSKKLFFFAILVSYWAMIIDAVLIWWSMEFKVYAHFALSVGIAASTVIFGTAGIYILDPNRGVGRIAGTYSIYIAMGILIAGSIVYRGKTFFNLKYWKYALRFSLPLILYSIGNIILAQASKIMIDKLVGRAETGLFSFGCSIGSVVAMLLAGTNTAWAPWFLQTMKRGDIQLIQKRMKLYLVCFTAATLCLIFGTPLIVRVLAPPKFWASMHIAAIMMAAEYFMLLYQFFANIEIYEKQTWFFALGTFSAGIICIVMNILLIPKFGYVMAAWSTVISNACLVLFHWFSAAKILKRDIFSIKLCLAASFIVVVCSFLVSHFCIS